MWVWFHVGDAKISPEVVDLVDSRTIISAATIWEVMLLLEKGRLRSRLSAEETVLDWLAAAPMRVVPIDKEIALLSRGLQFTHDDPADRFIAATAYRMGAPLATSDRRLLDLPWLDAFPR
jgi:PIN domain nuclease of toxin-antitoxin system